MLACVTGKYVKARGSPFGGPARASRHDLTFTFLDVLVSSYQTGGTEASGLVPLDQVSLRYAKIEVEYKTQKPDAYRWSWPVSSSTT